MFNVLSLLHLKHTYPPITGPAQDLVNTNTSSTPNPAILQYHTRPVNITVAVGEPAVFTCGVPEASPNLTFILYGSHGNYSLTCPKGHVEDIPQVR